MSDLRGKLYKGKETLKPFLLVVGPLIKIDGVYVIDDQQLKVPSCLDTLDLTCKSIYALACRYPAPTLRLWRYFQRTGYEIQESGKTLIKPVTKLLGLTRQALFNLRILMPEEIQSTSIVLFVMFANYHFQITLFLFNT